MLHKLFATAMFAATVVLSACGGGGEALPSEPPPGEAALQVKLQVTVQTLGGAAIAGVALSAQPQSGGSAIAGAVTDASGQATLQTAPDQDLSLQLAKAGFANQIKRLKVAGGDTQIVVSMMAREAAQTLADIGAGGIIQGKDGAQASFPAGSLVDAAGNVVSGAIQMQITPVNVLADTSAFPGAFAGTQGAASPVAIVSYGTAEFHPTQGGQKLQVAPGKTVQIEIPMYADKNPDGSFVALGQQIPLWSLNETTGIWLQEGTGTVVVNASSPTGLALRADVSHFSWWNCDDILGAEARIDVKCMLLDGSGNPTVPLAAGQSCTVRGIVPNAARRPAQLAEIAIDARGSLQQLRIPAGTMIELHAKSQFNGQSLIGLTSLELPTNSVTSVVIGLASEVAVTLSSPARGATLLARATATVQVSAPVTRVELYLGGIKVAEDASEPYVLGFDTLAIAEGFSSLQARAVQGASTVVGASEVRSVIIDRSPPVVSLTRLDAAAGDGLVKLLAQAADLSPISVVEFFKGDVKIGEDTTFPYNFTYTLQANDASSVNFTAKARDAAGLQGVSNVISFGTQAPTVSLTRTPNSATITASLGLTYEATAASTNGINRVEFFKGSSKIGEDSTAPYQLLYTVTGADQPRLTVMAKAVDNSGNVASAELTTPIVITSTDTTPPSITLDALASPITLGGMELAAAATDNVGVAKVEFYVNDALQGVSTAPASGKFRKTVDVSLLNGPVQFKAVAFDAAGNQAQSLQSATVSISAAVLADPGNLLAAHRGICKLPSMAFAPDGTAYVGISTAAANGQSDATVLKRVGNAWQSLGLANDSSQMRMEYFNCPTIAVDSSGTVFAAFRAVMGADGAGPDRRLMVRKFNGTSWETVRDILGTSASSVNAIEMQSDAQNRPVIVWSGGLSFSLNTVDSLTVERYNGASWDVLATGFGGLGGGNAMGEFKFFMQSDSSLTVAVKASTGPFSHAIAAAHVSSTGALTQLGNASTRIIDEVGDTTAGLQLMGIAVQGGQTVVSYVYGNSSGFTSLRSKRFDTASNAWVAMGDFIQNGEQRDASLAVQGGTVVQILHAPANSMRRWNGSAWSATTSISPVSSAQGQAVTYQDQLFMAYTAFFPCCGASGAGVVRLNLP